MPALKIPSTVNFTATLDVEASLEGDKGDPLMFLVANTGRPMQVGGFPYPVILDMEGASFDKPRTPVIGDHDTAKRIGHTVEQGIAKSGGSVTLRGRTFTGPAIVAVAQVSSTMALAQGIVKDAQKGFPFQVSVGAKLQNAYLVKEGQSAFVNGSSWKGPLIVAPQSRQRELSITVLGADPETSAVLTASQTDSLLEVDAMGFDDFVRGMGHDPSKLTPELRASLTIKFDEWTALQARAATASNPPAPQSGSNGGAGGGGNTPPPLPGNLNAQATADLTTSLRKAATDETDRIDSIKAAADRFEGVKKIQWGGKELTVTAAKKMAIKEGSDPRDFELAIMRAAMPGDGSPVGAPAVHIVPKDIAPDALECAILRRTGIVPMRNSNARTGRDYGIECMYKENILEASHGKQYQVGTISGLFDLQIRAAGSYYGGMDRTSTDFFGQTVKAWEDVKASGFSTINVVNVLENVMNKAALASFQGVEAIWPFIAGRMSLSDFRPHNLYRIDWNGSFKKVARDGELKHVSMTDSKRTIQADTYGGMITIDRQTMKNDSLAMIVAKAMSMGLLCGERVEESVMVLLLLNAGSFFSVGNGNYMSGADSALSIAALSAAREKFRNQVVNGKPVSVSPRLLLVGTALEDIANNLWANTEFAIGYGNADTGLISTRNPHKGLYKPYISPWVNNTGILDQDGNAVSGQSSTKWWLLGPNETAQGSVIKIGFVDGRDTPYFDSAETQFNVPSGLQLRSWLDWGVALHEEKLGVLSAGA